MYAAERFAWQPLSVCNLSTMTSLPQQYNTAYTGWTPTLSISSTSIQKMLEIRRNNQHASIPKTHSFSWFCYKHAINKHQTPSGRILTPPIDKWQLHLQQPLEFIKMAIKLIKKVEQKNLPPLSYYFKNVAQRKIHSPLTAMSWSLLQIGDIGLIL